MTATYTFDIFTSLDGNASYGPPGDWGGYWGKQGPEFLDHRLAAYDGEQRMVFGATTFGLFVQMLPAIGEERDPWMDRMLSCPATVVSSTLQGPFDWPDATVANGDAVEIVRRMKEESDVPIRSHGSLSLNRALMAAGLVDRIQITVFPVIAAQTGTSRSSRVPATSTSTDACQRATGAARRGTQLEDHRHRAFPQFSWVLLP